MAPQGPDLRFEDVSRLSRRTLLGGSLGLLATGSTLPLIAKGTTQPSLQSTVHTTRDADDESFWDMVADQFIVRPEITYMNTGTRGPSPASVYLAQVDAIRAANEDRLGYVNNVYTSDFKDSLRRKLAGFVGCAANEIAITNNTTEGMGIGTLGVELRPGDEIIYSGGAQPVNLRCARDGTVPVVVDLSAPGYHPPPSTQHIVDAFEAAITKRTRLISFCHINYTDGCVMPVAEICEMARSRGVLTLVDGAHPPGMLDLDLKALGCDMYAGACHKWMLAAQLTGFLYVREDLQDRVWPAIYSGPVQGRNMYGAPDDAEKGRTAQRYETHGSINYAAGKSIDAAVDFHNGIGAANIEARDRFMASVARERLASMDGVQVFVAPGSDLCAGLVSFRVRDVDTKALNRFLWETHQVYIREVRHPEIDWDANRLSLHIMVNRRKLDAALDAIEEVARKPSLVAPFTDA